MIDPLFWLGLSLLLVAVSLTAVLVAAIPAFLELARAARSVEKLADTLKRELPPTLESIRLTGMEISELTDEVSDGVKSAGQVVKQVDRSIGGAKKQAQNVQITTRSVFAGVKAAWKSFSRSPARRSSDRLPPAQRAVESRSNINGTPSLRSSGTPLPSELGAGAELQNRKELPESSSKLYRERDAYPSESSNSNEVLEQETNSVSRSQRYYEGWEPSEKVNNNDE